MGKFSKLKSKVMKIAEKSIEKIPTWAICAIINDDRTGLTDEDIRMIEDWFAETGYDHIRCLNEDAEPYFTHCPAFGLACDVYDVECLIFA